MSNITVPEVLAPVENYIDKAKLVAFDGCHKIYLALDEWEANWFTMEYPHVVAGSPDEMLATVVGWWEQSCFLKFVSGVTHNEENPNAGFIDIVPQGAEEEYGECDNCGTVGEIMVFGLCPDCDEEQFRDDEEE
jgi:hypothetical protein